MATNKRKQDEKHLKMLREMVAFPHNKQCFDCHQRGPTYVNMTIGSYVCTSCSGILRGLNPPHRVKSISMASFTPEEMEFVRSRGNELCKNVYLGMYDSKSHTEPSSKDEHKVREFMNQKYEKKRWYVAPTEAMYEGARKMNTPTVEKKETKPLKTLVGNSVPKLSVAANQPSVPHPHPSSAPQPPAPLTAPPSEKLSSVNLLDDLGGDPFASAPAPQKTSSGGGFADFSAFNSQPVPAANQNTLPAQQPVTFPPSAGGGLLQPMNTNQPPAAGGGNLLDTSSPATSQTASAISGGDRYAALADVFSNATSTAGTPAVGPSNSSTAVDWVGGGGGMSWTPGAGGATCSTSTTVTGAGSNLWTSSGGPGTNSSFMAFGSTPQIPTSTNTSASFPTAANPFGTTTAQQRPPVANPFFGGSGGGAQGAFSQAGASMGQFGQTQQATPVGSFGGAPPTSMAAGQFGVQNGGWGGVQASQPSGTNNIFSASIPPGAGYGGAQKPAQGSYGAMPQQPTQQQSFGGWGQQQPAANPFMGGAGNQQGIPPRTNPTNPFL